MNQQLGQIVLHQSRSLISTNCLNINKLNRTKCLIKVFIFVISSVSGNDHHFVSACRVRIVSHVKF